MNKKKEDSASNNNKKKKRSLGQQRAAFGCYKTFYKVDGKQIKWPAFFFGSRKKILKNKDQQTTVKSLAI